MGFIFENFLWFITQNHPHSLSLSLSLSLPPPLSLSLIHLFAFSATISYKLLLFSDIHHTSWPLASVGNLFVLDPASFFVDLSGYLNKLKEQHEVLNTLEKNIRIIMHS